MLIPEKMEDSVFSSAYAYGTPCLNKDVNIFFTHIIFDGSIRE